ncbi:hypothetical protein F8271_04420 [Micromonospora sp. ALFpr18c]|uniref:hypothetical protein n=1 Tax=Micromonospora sp. ALFpr18c TaxID=1458665 RepID=UPI00124BC431|nr:hypothetical protein [Micromonospora sp. ALFpr18c]KAB1947572.1 hypothetical protein F8271_04420 [Micromonospora sp. ALFpr18c]
MLLDIDTEVFDGDDHLPVIEILKLVARGRHDWSPTGPEAVRAASFVATLYAAKIKGPDLKLWATKAVEAAADRGLPAAARPRSRRGFAVTTGNVGAVADDLGKPAVLVVENRIGDGGFVQAMAAALDDQRVVQALRKRWLKFCHSGGTGQMPALAADECRDFSLIIRVAMLLDSDRDDAAKPSPNDAKVRQAQRDGVPHVHMLTWRMVENYVPFQVWDRHFPHRTDKVKELRGMVPQQRGYKHLKVHFVGKDGKMPSPLMPEGLMLSEADFHELGPDVVAELRQVLAMIHEIL